jgi:hypothetical protein
MMGVRIETICKCRAVVSQRLGELFQCATCGRWLVLVELPDGDVQLETLAEKGEVLNPFYTRVKPGARVRLVGAHPWAGAHGVFVKLEEVMGSMYPLVQLENGQRCFVMIPRQWVMEQ